MTDPIQPATDEEVARRLTAVVRAADQHFESVGGSSRHYVVDCLGPALIDAGLAVVDAARIDAERAEKDEWLRTAHTNATTAIAERAAREESEAVRDRMRALLDAVAVAVRGPPASNALHDHARLPDEVAGLTARAEKAEGDAQHAREESAAAFDAAATHLARAERAEGERSDAVETLRIVRRNLDAARDNHDAEAAGLSARAERAEALLARLTDPDPNPCRYDLHNLCQEHGLSARPCATAAARALLDARAALSRKDGA